MKLTNTHISYCSNIHSGESWKDHFEQLQEYVPLVKAQVSPNQPFGLGLRISNAAAKELSNPDELDALKTWLQRQDVYVFTLNGFPFGDFHQNRVKDNVHFPDWTTHERYQYTLNLFNILAELVGDLEEAGISTSPLSYRFWFKEGTEEWNTMLDQATQHIVQIAEFLYTKEVQTGKYLHLDIEPEPDGVLEDATEFLNWYNLQLLPKAIAYFKERGDLDPEQVKNIINRYICICYDVCHFALEYEQHETMMNRFEEEGIKIGKFQVSAALKIDLATDADHRELQRTILQQFDEPIYLHQVIARKQDGSLSKYRDLPEALAYFQDPEHIEWRSHFHVPIFLEKYGLIGSTQEDIKTVIALQKQKSRTNHIEVETYTWAVLPKDLQVPIQDSIAREINWLTDLLK